MGFLKDLINGHEAFFNVNESKKEETNELKDTKLILLKDSEKEEIKAA